MKTYNITNKISGTDFGNFEVNNEAEALDAYAREAGYESFDLACAAIEGGSDLVVTERSK